MSFTHICPKDIRDQFKGDEAQKRKARLAAMGWMRGLRIEAGDIVLVPDAQTGDLITFTKPTPPKEQ